jgi:predicted nuclease of predicted toxin-antitoxin system
VKFLIDECLSPELVKLVQEKGHGESTHVVWRKLAGKKDWELKPIILEGDWTFVTRNSVDFRGPPPIRARVGSMLMLRFTQG